MVLLRVAASGGEDEEDLKIQPQPARIANLERYLRRNKIEYPRRSTTIPKCPPLAQVWKVPEHIFFDTAALITGSFDSQHWVSIGNGLIIHSSPNQDLERKALHSFLGCLNMATKTAANSNLPIAGMYWKQAFENLDLLITGHYHDTWPNLLQKINDLKSEGHSAVAVSLQNHLARSCAAYNICGPLRTILQAQRLIHLDDMEQIEDRVMQCYVDLFDRFLGLLHYNSFVMRMNLARRKLFRNSWARLEDFVPSLSFFDSQFGPVDTRSLDIILLRIEVLGHRGKYEWVEAEARLLVERAHMKVNDMWQRLYYLIHGHYHLGLACYAQDKQDSANFEMLQGADYIAQFSQIDQTGIFNPEKAVLASCLEKLGRRVGDL